MYQPVVSPSGGCRSPFMGCSPVFTFSAIPTFRCGGASTHRSPYFLQTRSCSHRSFSVTFLFPSSSPQNNDSVPRLALSLEIQVPALEQSICKGSSAPWSFFCIPLSRPSLPPHFVVEGRKVSRLQIGGRPAKHHNAAQFNAPRRMIEKRTDGSVATLRESPQLAYVHCRTCPRRDVERERHHITRSSSLTPMPMVSPAR